MKCSLFMLLLGTPLLANPGLTGQLYVFEVTKDTNYTDGGLIQTITPDTDQVTQRAHGMSYTTPVDGTMSALLSTGTGITLGSDTLLKVEQFEQTLYSPERSDLSTEPSNSTNVLRLLHGLITLCTTQYQPTSKFEVLAQNARISPRGRIAIRKDDTGTTVYVIEGRAEVQPNAQSGSVTVVTGQEVFIPADPKKPLNVVQLSKDAPEVDEACMLRQRAYFDTTTQLPTEQIMLPLTPLAPTGTIVSPARSNR